MLEGRAGIRRPMQRDQEGERHIRAFTFAPPQAAKQPDATGALPLDIAGSTGASGEVKDAIVRACPEVVTKSTLTEALKRNWGMEAVSVSLASAPEVCDVGMRARVIMRVRVVGFGTGVRSCSSSSPSTSASSVR